MVLSYVKVRKHLEQHPEDKEKIFKFVDEIKGDYRFSVVGATAGFLDKTFMRLYDGITLKTPDNFDIRKLQKDYHLVLVPNHQSHADYLALQYLLYKNYKLAVYIAAGINLNIFPIGDIFKRCGAFFLRRKFDDELYKITFQGYLYYLLKSDKIVEFFFEGGRTRTGKLLSPKYGLFSMLLDAHSNFDDPKPLMFIPVSIAHEMIPEEKAHAKELSGKKKEKESSAQLLKLYKLFSKKLGTVHVRFGKGIVVDECVDLKAKTREMAFSCFRAVGKGMPITPSSLLALIMLDDPIGALTWKQIELKSVDILDYCDFMQIPYTGSLQRETLSSSLKVAMDMFINNKKVELIKREKLNKVFYTINDESRAHLLYHKNMILHHFLVPGIINATWFNIFNGNIKDAKSLTKFLMVKRKELKYEFYLPSVKEMIGEALKVVEFAVDRKLDNLENALNFSNEELYSVAVKVRRFSTAFCYIYECYYISAVTVKYLAEESFNIDRFLTVAKELYEMELDHGRVVKYPESFSVPNLKVTLKYLENLGAIEQVDNEVFQLIDVEQINHLIEKFAQDLYDQVAINIKFNQHA